MNITQEFTQEEIMERAKENSKDMMELYVKVIGMYNRLKLTNNFSEEEIKILVDREFDLEDSFFWE